MSEYLFCGDEALFSEGKNNSIIRQNQIVRCKQELPMSILVMGRSLSYNSKQTNLGVGWLSGRLLNSVSIVGV